MEVQTGRAEAQMEPWRVRLQVAADSHHLDKGLNSDPDPHHSEKFDPDPQHSEKL
jgi:hypothetical protein